MTDGSEDVPREVLSLATEDLTGLWEAWWRVNSLRPDLRVSERLALAEQAVEDLLGDGLIRLYRGSWSNHSEVPSDAAATVLREWGAWVPQDDSQLTFYIATSAGERTYGVRPSE